MHLFSTTLDDLIKKSILENKLSPRKYKLIIVFGTLFGLTRICTIKYAESNHHLASEAPTLAYHK